MDDLISRLSEIRSNYNCMDENDEPYYRALSEAIQLVSAQPERTGKWIHGRELAREMISDCIVAIRYDGWECSECNCLVEQEREPLYKFCPNCGARMEERR